MHLLVGSLLESPSPNGQEEVVRVLHIDRGQDLAQVIRIDHSSALPEARRLSEIEAALVSKSIRVLTTDPFSYLQIPEAAISAKHCRRRDAPWRLIEPIVAAPNGGAFAPEIRGKLIRDVIKRAGGCKKHIYRYLRRYWQGGMTPNALLPLFHLCGA